MQKGDTLNNRYVIETELGRGAYGVVYMVTDKYDSSRMKKVSKIIQLDINNNDEMENAIMEASILASLEHPNILKFYDSFLLSRYFCIITEYCEVETILI